MKSLTEQNATATRLLVSVRNAAEAELALAAGVTLLDVKEPLAGPLGAASSDILNSVLELAERMPGWHAPAPGWPAQRSPQTVASDDGKMAIEPTISAALGELLDYEPRTLPPGLRLAKFGLAGCGAMDDWPHKWQAAIATFSPSIDPVAVVYADYQRANAPRPVDVIAVGREVGCRYVLVDTFDKSRGNLLELWSWLEIERLVENVQAQGLRIVLAGSLTVSHIRRLLHLQPNVVAVRGAACGGDRNGALDAERVRELVSIVAGSRLVAKRQIAAAADL